MRSRRTRFVVTVQLTQHRDAGKFTDKYLKDIHTLGYVSYTNRRDCVSLRAEIVQMIIQYNPIYSPDNHGNVEILNVVRVS